MRQSKDFLDQIIEYESGELNDKEIIEMFSEMIQDGTVWQLQGSYGRTASAFIESGWLDEKGNILKTPK
jgi:hypothetical protein